MTLVFLWGRWPGLAVRVSTYPSPGCGLSPAPPQIASCNPPTAGSSQQGTGAPVSTGCVSPRCNPLSRSVQAIQPFQRDPVFLEDLRDKEQKRVSQVQPITAATHFLPNVEQGTISSPQFVDE